MATASPADHPQNHFSATKLPKVTVVVPTCSLRQPWQGLLRQMFEGQDYKGQKEMIMYDSPCGKRGIVDNFGLGKPNVIQQNTMSRIFTYLWEDKPVKTGDKRNRLQRLATGDILVHFDDDDYYGPSYISTMVHNLMTIPNVTMTKVRARNLVYVFAWVRVPAL